MLFHTVPKGRCEKAVISHRPPTKKYSVKICFSLFQEPLDSFSFFKNHVPGNKPVMHSWMSSRNALLGVLQEHAPVQVLGTYSGTPLEC